MSQSIARSIRIAILGNSGSGKSTLARWMGEKTGSPILDLDTIAWMPDQPAVRRSFDDAARDLQSFCRNNSSWIVEGCYASLIEQALSFRPTLLFLNPGIEVCLAHCRSRPWESHKFASKEEQDSHLEFLLNWVREYSTRDGELSLAGHRCCFDRYNGAKFELVEPVDGTSLEHVHTDDLEQFLKEFCPGA